MVSQFTFQYAIENIRKLDRIEINQKNSNFKEFGHVVKLLDSDDSDFVSLMAHH